MTHPDKGNSDAEGRIDVDMDIEELVEDLDRSIISIRMKIGLVTMGLVGLGLASLYLPNAMDRFPARPLHIWLGLLTAFLVLLLPGPVRSSSEGRKLLTTLLVFLSVSFLVLVLVDTAWPEPILPNGSLSKEARDSGLVWDKVLRGGGKERDVWLSSLPNGDFLVSSAAYHREKPAQLTVRRIDSQGNILWEKSPEITCRGIRNIMGFNNGELLVIGSLSPGSDEIRSSYLALIEAGKDGDLVWQRAYSGEESWTIRTGIQVADGGFILGGNTNALEDTDAEYEIIVNGRSYGYSYGGHEPDVLLLRVDKSGDLVWEKTWDYFWDDRVMHIQPSMSDGYILWMEGKPKEVHIAEIDDSGQILWHKNITLEYDMHSTSTGITSDGGFIIACHHSSTLPGNSISVIKIDGKGDLEWQRRYPIGWRYLETSNIFESDEGDIILFCEERDSETQEPLYLYILKIDDENNVTKKKELQTDLFLRDVKPASRENGYILAGTSMTWIVDLPLTKWYDWYNTDTRLMKLDLNWEDEEVFVPVKEVDPVWSRFPIHGREPTEIDLERGYRLISQDITCTVYCTADFARINYAITVEILNQSLDSIQIKVPYGDNEIWRTEEIHPSTRLAYHKSAELDVEVEQDRDETIITIFLLPEMVEKGKAIIHFLYRIFDLPDEEGVYVFDEAYRKGNTRWEQGVLTNYSPGLMDQGTWILNFTMKPNSDTVIPTYWEPRETNQITYDHTNIQGLFWQYVGEIPQSPVFKAIYRYPP